MLKHPEALTESAEFATALRTASPLTRGEYEAAREAYMAAKARFDQMIAHVAPTLRDAVLEIEK